MPLSSGTPSNTKSTLAPSTTTPPPKHRGSPSPALTPTRTRTPTPSRLRPNAFTLRASSSSLARTPARSSQVRNVSGSSNASIPATPGTPLNSTPPGSARAALPMIQMQRELAAAHARVAALEQIGRVQVCRCMQAGGGTEGQTTDERGTEGQERVEDGARRASPGARAFTAKAEELQTDIDAAWDELVPSTPRSPAFAAEGQRPATAGGRARSTSRPKTPASPRPRPGLSRGSTPSPAAAETEKALRAELADVQATNRVLMAAIERLTAENAELVAAWGRSVRVSDC